MGLSCRLAQAKEVGNGRQSTDRLVVVLRRRAGRRSVEARRHGGEERRGRECGASGQGAEVEARRSCDAAGARGLGARVELRRRVARRGAEERRRRVRGRRRLDEPRGARRASGAAVVVERHGGAWEAQADRRDGRRLLVDGQRALGDRSGAHRALPAGPAGFIERDADPHEAGRRRRRGGGARSYERVRRHFTRAGRGASARGSSI